MSPLRMEGDIVSRFGRDRMNSYNSASDATSPKRPSIRHLSIERYRGISKLSWHPGECFNVILGGGDAGKTTILEAIGLLLSPTYAGRVSDTDYHARNIEAGFVIEAVMSLPDDSGINGQVKASWPWRWNGTQAVVPTINDSRETAGEPVYRLRVRGTEDLELAYEVLQPDDTPDNFTVGLRRSIGLVRLGGDDGSDRDLRLVQGSALDRLLADNALRSRIASALADTDVGERLIPDAKDTLGTLDGAFKQQGLPDRLGLSITGGPGPSIASLIGLTADLDDVRLPLTAWGAGTRRLAALTIAGHNQRKAPIAIVDEIERGLEPYRQRALIEKLHAGGSQVFVTTHSPSAIVATAPARFWYVDHAGRLGPLDETKTVRHRTADPDAYLARLAIIAEGKTEVGFASALLEKALSSPLERHGVHVIDGGGHESTLDLLEALSDGGVNFGGFVDDEGQHPERWRRVRKTLGPRLFRWPSGSLEQNVITAVPDESLEALVADPAHEKSGTRQRHLAMRLGIEDKCFPALRAAAGTRLREVIIEAALGRVPDETPGDKQKRYKSQAQTWFKSIEGGRELAQKVFALELWPHLSAQLMPFCNAVRNAVGLHDIEDIER